MRWQKSTTPGGSSTPRSFRRDSCCFNAQAGLRFSLRPDAGNSGSIRPLSIRQLTPTNHNQGPLVDQLSSATDAVADVCGIRCVDHPNDLQLDARRQHLELPSATAQQHRDLMDLQLVQHTGLERPLRRVRAMYQHVPVPGGGLRLAIALAIPSVTYVTNG